MHGSGHRSPTRSRGRSISKSHSPEPPRRAARRSPEPIRRAARRPSCAAIRGMLAMLDNLARVRDDAPPELGVDVVMAVRDLASRELAPLVRQIDEGLYPEGVMRAFGRAGAFGAHLPDERRSTDLATAIRAMSAAGEYCLSTSFCMWCQDALAWYIFASDNDGLKASLGRRVAAGEALGGTALSNPMKAFFGIEQIRLKGNRVDGGDTG